MARPPKSETAKDDFLAAAKTLLVAKGVDAVSLRQIAKAAGYGASSIYNYFESKDAILARLAADANQRLAATLEDCEALAELGAAYVAFALSNPEDFELLFRMTPSKRRSLSEEADPASAYAAVVQAVVAAQNKGQVAENFDPDHVAYGIWSLAHGQATLQLTMLAGFDADFEAINQSLFEAFLRGFQ